MDTENTLITILTTTFNRSKKISKLFTSLKKQNSSNFKWIIVDDGSTDDTKEKIDEFINDDKKLFEIEYFYKENGGKHTAINYAMEYLDTPLTIIIDSDDQLVENGIHIIEYYWDKYNKYKISTLTFEHLFDDGEPMVKIKKNEVFEKRSLYPVKNHALGDYTDVYVTKELVKYKFPVFKNEKFLNEGYLYYNLSLNNKSIFIDIPLTIGGYQDDGLTKNVRKLQVSNYRGTMYTANLFMDKMFPLWFRIKNGILFDYVAIKNNISIKKIVKKNNHTILKIFSAIPARLYILLKDR